MVQEMLKELLMAGVSLETLFSQFDQIGVDISENKNYTDANDHIYAALKQYMPAHKKMNDKDTTQFICDLICDFQDKKINLDEAMLILMQGERKGYQAPPTLPAGV